MSSTLTMNVLLKLVDEMSGGVQAAVTKSKGHLDGFAEHAKKVGRELQDFGRSTAIAGAAITGTLGVAVKQFADLEQGMAQLKSTMTSKDGLSANFQKVSDLAVELGNQLPGNTADFAGMINKLLQLGVTEQAVLGGVGAAAAKLAVVMKLPYDEAATVAAKLKEATGTAQEDMLKFMDTIQRVGHQGVQATEMMYAFARSGGALKSFGVQGEEAARQISSLFAQIIKAGISGETAGTAIGAIFNRLTAFETESIKGPATAKEMLKDLGIELEFFDKQTQQFKGVENMVAQFDKLRELGQLERANILQEWFGGGQDQQIVSLLTQGGVAGNEAMQKLMADQADLATRSAAQLQTLSAKWEAAFGTFQNLLAKIGELLAPKLGEFVDWFGKVSANIQAWIGENKEFASTVATVVGGLGVALTALGGGALAAGAISTALGAIATGISAIAGAATLLAANPVGLAILGIGLAGAAGFAWGKWFAEQINYAAEAVSGTKGATLGTAIADLVDWIRKQMDEIPKAIKRAFDNALKFLRDLPRQFVEVGQQIIQGLIDGIKGKAAEVVESVKKLGSDSLAAIKDLLRIRSPSEVMFDLGVQTAAGFALGIGQGAGSVAEQAAALAQLVPDSVIGAGAANEGLDPSAYHAQREALERQHQQRLYDIRSFFESASLQNVVRYRQLNVESMGFFFSQLGALMTSKSKAMFEVGKAAAVAETIFNTYRAAQGAYAALAGIPIVGPALGIAAAAAAVVSGLARVQQIRATKFGTASASPVISGGGLSGPVIGGDAGVSVPASPVNAPQAAAPERTVNLFLRGTDVYSAQAIRDQLVPALNDALGDGVTLNVRTAA
jgi:TP901 family phage tail tape measure protein